MKKLVLGILAHVDAGKTTLSESMLYISGSIRKAGRVDNGDAFLDTHELERLRGITIFSKQAVFSVGDVDVTLLDTPGHVDFSAEMERTLQVLDYAILVISGADGVQGHTETLWRLLKRYEIPTFLFINKMDQDGTDKNALLSELKKRLDENCIDFSWMKDGCLMEDISGSVDLDEFMEAVAMCDDELLEAYLESGEVSAADIRHLVQKRQLFPCYFGSALKQTGVEEFLKGLEHFTCIPEYPEEFSAKVYKISRDEQGNRLTHLKVTGGVLKVKDLLKSPQDDGETWSEKVNQVRIYSGAKFDAVPEAEAGCVCAVTGLSQTFPGEGLGAEAASALPVLEPVLSYQISLPEDCDVHTMLKQLQQLEEEEPLLHIVWDETLKEIHAQIMGEVQTEILKSLIQERFGVTVGFDTGNIVYKETIKNTVEGVGHYEPLRHYAEAHLILEPGEPGTGLQFATNCSEDLLDRNWQRLILTHLEEKEHKGVLTGSVITDMKITLAAGRAHLKHTEGGDFRQATYRAVRHGLMQAESVLLEPYYDFRLELPAEMVGRAMSDIQRMNGEFSPPQQEGDTAILTGSVPVANMRDYQMEVISYTKGRGRLFCTLKGYFPCHNAEEVIASIGYDPEHDLENPTGSVFCAHGAGFVVKWDQVEEYMHIESVLKPKKEEPELLQPVQRSTPRVERSGTNLSWEEEKELQKMIEAAYKPRPKEQKRKFSYGKAKAEADTKYKGSRSSVFDKKYSKDYLLVDGYNIIFAWEDLRDLAKDNIDAARGKLQDMLSNYQGYRKCTVIVVFDAYKLEGFTGDVQKYHNIYVVFTKEAETADQYIEKVAHEIGRKYNVTVATSDGTEQVIIRGQGCLLLSASELREELEIVNREIREEHLSKVESGNRNYLFNYLDEKTAEHMEEVRLGKNKEK